MSDLAAVEAMAGLKIPTLPKVSPPPPLVNYGGRQKHSRETILAIQNLYRKGLTVKVIAEQLGVSTTSVHKYGTKIRYERRG